MTAMDDHERWPARDTVWMRIPAGYEITFTVEAWDDWQHFGQVHCCGVVVKAVAVERSQRWIGLHDRGLEIINVIGRKRLDRAAETAEGQGTDHPALGYTFSNKKL